MRAHPTHENPGLRPQDWTPTYWKQATHGSSWDRVKDALRRDWAQTKSDFTDDGKDLRQNVTDTVRQATGNQQIPAAGEPNVHPPRREWADAEAAVRYGVAAREQYGSEYARWSDALEVMLSREWDVKQTGRPFSDVRADVRLGWHSKARGDTE